MDRKELNKYILKIHEIAKKDLSCEEIVSHEMVSDYYSKSAFYYKKIHSPGGAMHLPISFSDEVSHGFKLQYQANSIEKIIKENGYNNILELGCGMGFNTNYLAKKHPKLNFTGIDLTFSNISFAKEKAKGFQNATFNQGDFDNIQASDGKYDLIFAIETLCYSKNLTDLIIAIGDKLSDNGRLVIFDAYVKQDIELSDNAEIKAYKLLSWGFSLEKFQNISDVMESQNFSGLYLEELAEYSKNVLPNLIAFQNGAKKALHFSVLLKFLLKFKIIPLALIKQLSAGVIGPYFLKNELIGYYKLVLKKTLPNNGAMST